MSVITQQAQTSHIDPIIIIFYIISYKMFKLILMRSFSCTTDDKESFDKKLLRKNAYICAQFHAAEKITPNVNEVRVTTRVT